MNTILFFSKFNKENCAFRIVCIYSLCMLLIQIYSYYLTKIRISNLYVSHWYFNAQFLIFSIFFYWVLIEKWQKNLVKGVSFIVAAILLIHYYYTSLPYDSFHSLVVFVTSFPIIVYSTFHLYNMLNAKKEFYYISISILVYLTGSTSLFLLGNLSVNVLPKAVFKLVWNLNVYLYIIYQLFFLLEFYKNYWKKKLI